MFKLRTKNLPAEVTLNNLPTVKQAFIIASVMIIVAVLFTKLVHSDFIYLALVPALGLLIAGISGLCPLITLLQKLPVNNK